MRSRWLTRKKHKTNHQIVAANPLLQKQIEADFLQLTGRFQPWWVFTENYELPEPGASPRRDSHPTHPSSPRPEPAPLDPSR